MKILKEKNVLKNAGYTLIIISIIFSLLSFQISSENILPADAGDYQNIQSSFYDGNQGTNPKLTDTENMPVSDKISDTAQKQKYYVVPSGETYGVKMYTDGLIVTDISYVVSPDNKEYSPAKQAGIKKGDIIYRVNGEKITTNESLSRIISDCVGELTFDILRDEKELSVNITPVISNDNNTKKIGIWVRDSTAGIGTMTYYDPQTLKYGALGHAITDTDTGKNLIVSKGSLSECSILSLKKGQVGSPGEMSGNFFGGPIADISDNNDFGIFGTLKRAKNTTEDKSVEVATRFEVKEGPATILCDIDKTGVKSYDIEIIKISKSAALNNKGIIFSVTDKELIAKTGGIVQGMSGSPILQNGKIVGAVTHVFVNDPTRGYAIFIENMIDESNRSD